MPFSFRKIAYNIIEMPHDHMGNVVIKFPPEFDIVSSMFSF